MTADRVRQTFARTFDRLFALQQSELGRPGVHPGGFYATTSCQRGAPGTPQTGAGDDWICVEQWQESTGHVDEAAYDVTVHTDGCLDATGPAGVIGAPELTSPSGTTFVNPLAEFDACFPT